MLETISVGIVTKSAIVICGFSVSTIFAVAAVVAIAVVAVAVATAAVVYYLNKDKKQKV